MEFVLVSTLLLLLVGAVIQLAMILHVRNTLVDCAGEGARYAALQGHGPASGVERTRTLISSALSPGYAESVNARTTN
ncbi:TadE/TadG family type IV pilus assembly protein, partial [Georgenia sp. 10Sc9-8]|nr:TadE/TadG family type IV pilus assembly protein [Georgenia halotolerans]